MKLLQKSDLVKAKANDRQREVAEGVKLAKRVDSLREIAVQEEVSLTAFRVKTLTAISDEIDVEMTKRDTLKTEVIDLEEKRLTALKPLDEEWERIRYAKDDIVVKNDMLATWGNKLHALEETLTDKEGVIKVKETETQNKLDDADRRLTQADQSNIEADRLKRLADDALLEAQEKSRILIADTKQREIWATERERVVGDRETDVAMKEVILEKDLIRLRDREETLKRNITRFKK